MINLLQHPQFGQIRVEKKGEDFIFCAKDVCNVLGISKYRDALDKLDDDERGLVKVDTPGGKQEMAFVTESGLYALAIRSNKPAVRRFRKWITSEVLPALRKYDAYSMDEKTMRRAKCRVEEKAVKDLLAEIDRCRTLQR